MKKVLITVSLIFSANFGFGQLTLLDFPDYVSQETSINETSIYLPLLKNKKNQSERLIAFVYDNSTVTDSTYFRYSGNRGSILAPEFTSFNSINFDTSIKFNKVNVPLVRDLRTYNSKNQLIIRERANYYSPRWNNSFKDLYYFNTDGQLETKFIETWNFDSLSWDDSYRADYVYNGSDLLGMYEFRWNGLNWDSTWRTENVYDKNGLLQESTAYSKTFVDTKNSYTYNATGQILTAIRQMYNSDDRNWRNQSKDSFTYNLAGQQLKYLNQSYDPNINQWKNSGQAFYFWLGDRLAKLESQRWFNNQWINQFEYLYSYNEKGNITRREVRVWSDSVYVYSGISDSNKRRYYYETFSPLVVHDIAELYGDVCIYPNPAQENISIKIENYNYGQTQVIVTDLQGRKVTESTIPRGKKTIQLNLNGLSKGVYIVRLQSADGRSYNAKINKT